MTPHRPSDLLDADLVIIDCLVAPRKTPVFLKSHPG
jgi:hypothetical protein